MNPDRPDWDDRKDDQVQEYSLLMPFLVVASKGGEFRDHDFVAGYQVGRIDGMLESRHIAASTFLVYSQLTEQLDLIAMRHGYTTDVLNDDDVWAQVGVTRVEA